MKLANRSGAAIATAVAALVLTVAVPGGAVSAHAASKGKCIGANACKGQSDCGGKNGCSGQNACKGQGYLDLSKAECDKIPGTKFEAE
jgi:uncharacterized membrane protein